MNDSILQLTMREMQLHFMSAQFWVAMLGVAFVLGLIGPFGTFESLSFAARFAYWFAVGASTYLVARGVSELVARWLTSRFKVHLLTGYVVGGLAAGLPVTLVVVIINLMAFGADAKNLNTWMLAINSIAISGVVAGLVAMFTFRQIQREQIIAIAQPEQIQVKRPDILNRLPHEYRGKLSYMTMQDHYVDIRTDKGGALVLMRFADAIAEASNVEGLQIHRSYWVAKDAVSHMVKKEGRVFLQLQDGTLLPVSRSYMAAVRAADFL